MNKKIIIGFTGGLGSTVLMKMAQKVCSEIVCIFIETKYTSPSDLKAVEDVKYSEESKPHKIKILEYPDLCKNILILNSKDRDFFCKKAITDILEEQRVELGFDLVLDGINYEHYVSFFDKKNQFGENYMMIFGELEINSEELKIIAANNLITFKRNPQINLLSRFPFYNFPITSELLESVARSDKYIKDLLKNDNAITRIRVIRKDQAIVEVERKNLPKILDVKSRKSILERLESFGFKSVSINLSGYLRNF